MPKKQVSSITLTTKQIREIKNLLKEITENQYFRIRNSEFYEPWDTSDETKDCINETCFYKLVKCVDLFKGIIDNNN